MFLGAGSPGSAHPYASVYLENRTHGAAADRAATFLAAHGLAVADAIPEPADHIAIGLAAMAELSRREATSDASAGDALLATQKAFVTAELCTWVTPFRERVERDDGDGYYAAAARITETALTQGYGAAPR